MLGYIETSAKTSYKVKECMNLIIGTVYNQQDRLLKESFSPASGSSRTHLLPQHFPYPLPFPNAHDTPHPLPVLVTLF